MNELHVIVKLLYALDVIDQAQYERGMEIADRMVPGIPLEDAVRILDGWTPR